MFECVLHLLLTNCTFRLVLSYYLHDGREEATRSTASTSSESSTSAILHPHSDLSSSTVLKQVSIAFFLFKISIYSLKSLLEQQ
jgi:hypothetical protein